MIPGITKQKTIRHYQNLRVNFYKNASKKNKLL